MKNSPRSVLAALVGIQMKVPSGKVMTIFLSVILPLALPGHGQSPQPRIDQFRCQRTVVPGGAGPNRLEIDVALLAAASPFLELSHGTTGAGQEPMILAKGGLGDLRLYDSANREVPYLLVAPPMPEPQWAEGRLLPVAATKKSSGFEIDLGQPLQVDSLRLAGVPAPFLKRVQLEGSGDRSRWTVLVEEGTLFDLPAEKLKRLELDFDPGAYRYFRITWDDSASARVPLPGTASARLVSTGALPPPLRAPVQYERRASEPGVSRYRLRLPGAALPVTAIELASADGNVLRKARVTEGRLSADEMMPQTLGMATLWHTVRGAASATTLRIPITAPQEAELELTITDGDSPPLDITAVSAICTYLPWIYFESSGTKPLTARFGHPGLGAPQYDLEPMRASIAKLRTAEAHWGEMRRQKPLVESPESGAVPATSAPIAVGSFRYSRKIPSSKPGLNALLLDAAVLAHTRMFDLRIAGADGHQIPYLVEKLEEPLTVNLPAPEKTQAPGVRSAGNRSAPGSQSYYRLVLPYANLPAARLVLTTSARVFRRDVRIVVERNPSDERQEPWTNEIATATWSHSEPETPAPALTLQLPSLDTAEANLVIEEGHDSPLPVVSASLLLPSYRMRFFRETDADLTLYCGNDNLGAPRYDLALLAPRLRGAAAEEISFGPEKPSESLQVKAQPLRTKWFRSVLVAAVVVLLVLIARLIKRSEAGNPD
ncbi:MAG: DUF3999 domain-containing protein [Acidobacteriia bacterium]|nr:DUF3999 domain-containing protein [Terriglobia bacterium]